MRIAIVTDAWYPQVNGVVRTLDTTQKLLKKAGHDVLIVSSSGSKTMPCPFYNEIRLSLSPNKLVGRMLKFYQPDCIHISTEGPLGWAARQYCLRHGLKFTTAFHTKFPEYVRARVPIPEKWSYNFLRRFHEPSQAVMVSTLSMEKRLRENGFTNTARWGRGVDTTLFNPHEKNKLVGEGPHQLYVGRVAVEKNIEAFLKTNVPGTKHVVGGGPELEKLKNKYPDVHFWGPLKGRDLASFYASADVFVFPSQTDTFGLVMLEALASGTPVAAYPVEGPIDVIRNPLVGCLNNNLEQAIHGALALNGDHCRLYAEAHSWQKSVDAFLTNLYDNNYASRMTSLLNQRMRQMTNQGLTSQFLEV